jgi:hypothetical protein
MRSSTFFKRSRMRRLSELFMAPPECPVSQNTGKYNIAKGRVAAFLVLCGCRYYQDEREEF